MGELRKRFAHFALSLVCLKGDKSIECLSESLVLLDLIRFSRLAYTASLPMVSDPSYETSLVTRHFSNFRNCLWLLRPPMKTPWTSHASRVDEYDVP